MLVMSPMPDASGSEVEEVEGVVRLRQLGLHLVEEGQGGTPVVVAEPRVQAPDDPGRRRHLSRARDLLEVLLDGGGPEAE